MQCNAVQYNSVQVGAVQYSELKCCSVHEVKCSAVHSITWRLLRHWVELSGPTVVSSLVRFLQLDLLQYVVLPSSTSDQKKMANI